MAGLVSFQRPGADGWRWTLGYRTRRTEAGYWLVQHWNGEAWENVANAVEGYARARLAATDDRERRAALRRPA